MHRDQLYHLKSQPKPTLHTAFRISHFALITHHHSTLRTHTHTRARLIHPLTASQPNIHTRYARSHYYYRYFVITHSLTVSLNAPSVNLGQPAKLHQQPIFTRLKQPILTHQMAKTTRPHPFIHS